MQFFIDFVRRNIVSIAWSLSAATVVVAVLAWGSSNGWQLARLSSYQLFPLFGLMTVSVLWSQYVIWTVVRVTHAGFKRLHSYFETTAWVVLATLILHPSLLVYQLWRDGFGLPPESYLRHFVAPGQGWLVLLGTFSWLVFMVYVFRRTFGKRKWWRWVIYAGDVAMLAVFYHGLRLGGQLQHGWFRAIWISYGAVFVAVLIYLRQKQLGAIVKAVQKGRA